VTAADPIFFSSSSLRVFVVASVLVNLTDKVALITGGKRIGLVVAGDLAGRGVDVALSYARSQAEAERAVETVRAAKRRAAAFHADLSQPAAAATVVDDDLDLLRRYVADGSHDAFARLVERHVALVYGTARRSARRHD